MRKVGVALVLLGCEDPGKDHEPGPWHDPLARDTSRGW